MTERWGYRYIATQDGTGGSVRHEVFALGDIPADRPLICVAPNEQKARLIAAAPEAHEANVLTAEGINTVFDNWDAWGEAKVRNHLQQLQDVNAAAINAAIPA